MGDVLDLEGDLEGVLKMFKEGYRYVMFCF